MGFGCKTSAGPRGAGDAVPAEGVVRRSEETGTGDSVAGDAVLLGIPSEEETLSPERALLSVKVS
jgi:hypothetical protein